MSFDFFNTSHLAFGSKLTYAFNELEKQLSIAENKVEKIREYLEIINQYSGRNYRVPQPDSAESPVRTNELFDIFNDKKASIQYFYYDNSTQSLNLKVLLYDQNNNVMTMASGSTTLKEGYCYVKKAITNNSSNKTLTFVPEKDSKQGTLLFRYNIGSNNQINITEMGSDIQLEQGDECGYSRMSKGSNITFPYTASGYECICVVGQNDNTNVTLNGRTIAKGGGYNMKRHVILYLKNGDVVSGSGITSGFKINYSK